MAFEYIWQTTLPQHSAYQRRATKARTETYAAAWRGIARVVTAAVRKLAEAHRRLRRARTTYRELQALDDRQLRDIGLHRTDIASVAEAVAAPRSETGVTVADLRRVGILQPAGRDSRVGALPRDDQRPRRPAPWAAKRRAGDAAQHERTTA